MAWKATRTTRERERERQHGGGQLKVKGERGRGRSLGGVRWSVGGRRPAVQARVMEAQRCALYHRDMTLAPALALALALAILLVFEEVEVEVDGVASLGTGGKAVAEVGALCHTETCRQMSLGAREHSTTARQTRSR